MKRLRLLEFQVHAVMVIDDGETMERTGMGPVPLALSDWAKFPAVFEARRAAEEATLNQAVMNTGVEPPKEG